MNEFEKSAQENAQPKSDPEILVSRQVMSETQTRPAAPAGQPVSPAAKPAAPSAKPTTSAAKAAAPRPVRTARRVPSASKPNASAAKPAVPAAKPATPAAKTTASAAAKPVASATKPAAPIAKPAATAAGAKKRGEKPKNRKKDDHPVEVLDRGGIIVSVIKALVYIAFVLVISGFLAVYGIRVANDVFAFVKDEMTVEVTISADVTLEEVSELLYSEGLVESADWFRLYTGFKYRDRELKFVSGTYTLNSTMNYNTLIAQLTPKAGRTIVSVLIPEGYTVDQIIDLLVSQGIGTREGYVDAIQNYDYNYEFLDVLDSIEKKDGRKYRLEGYLFPAKYDIYQDSGEVAVIDKMLAAFQANFLEENYDRCTELGLNMDEVITLASIIQREAHYSSDMYYISGVFHNRLNNAQTFPYLGSDATVQYALPEHKEELTREDLAIDSPYNTHLYPGLTPGAICNPGMDAITAALYPEDKLMETRGVKSYYFVAGADGYSLFGANEREHADNIAKAAADKSTAEALTA